MTKRMVCITAAAALTVAAAISAAHAQTMMVPLPTGRAPTEFYTNMPQDGVSRRLRLWFG
jgi:hypothetical protein